MKLFARAFAFGLLTQAPMAVADELDFLFDDEPEDQQQAQAEEQPAKPATAANDDEQNNQQAAESQSMDSEGVEKAVSQESTDDTQSEPELTPAKPEASNRRVIEEIVVTSTKTQQTLQEIPASVSTISGQLAKSAAITEVSDLVQYTPNVKFSNQISYLPNITIRGFGTPPLGRALESSVGISVDDVYYGRASFTNDPVFDLERLEVLRGPQGTLFGKNVIAGVLAFTTAGPEFEQGGNITLALGSRDEKRVEGGFSFPLLDDVLAARISFRARLRETGVYNTTRRETNRVDDFGFRIKTRWLVSDTAELNFNFWTAQSKTNGTDWQIQDATEQSLAEFREKDPATEADEFNGIQSQDDPTFSDRKTQSFSVKYIQDLGDFGIFSGVEMTAVAATSFVETPYALDADFSPINFVFIESLDAEQYKISTLENRFAFDTPGWFGLGEGMQTIFGVFGSFSDFNVTSRLHGDTAALQDYIDAGAFNGPPDPTTGTGLPIDPGATGAGSVTEFLDSSNNSKTESYAVFFQANWNITDRLDLLIGGRYGVESRKAFLASKASEGAFVFPPTQGQVDYEVTIVQKESDLSPKIAISYEVTEGINIFANTARGFKSGGVSAQYSPENLEFEPETAQSYEMGIKTRLAGGSVMLNATAFRTEFENLQVNSFNGSTFSIANAAAVISQGLEMDVQWLPPVDGLTVGGSVGFVDATYSEFDCASAPAENEPGSGPEDCPFETPRDPVAGASFQDLAGRTVAFAPKVSGSVYIQHNIPLTENYGLVTGFDMLYQGEQYLDADLDEKGFQEAVTKFNARIGLKPVNNPWSLILNVKNLTSEKERSIILDQPRLTGNIVTISTPDSPTWALDFNYRFGD
jgi:iron complex outermembrane receptor protein